MSNRSRPRDWLKVKRTNSRQERILVKRTFKYFVLLLHAWMAGHYMIS